MAKSSTERRRERESQRIINLVKKGGVKCACGGICRVEPLPEGGHGSMHPQIKFLCGQKECNASTDWYDEHDAQMAWKEWEREQQKKESLSISQFGQTRLGTIRATG